jgi:hypothetical protein
MATTHTTIKLGTVVYLAGGVGGYPPARWRVTGVTGGGAWTWRTSSTRRRSAASRRSGSPAA